MADRWMEDVAVADLVEAEKNAKAHDEELIDASLDRFGYIEPIVLDERTGRIISGHGRRERLLAAQAAGDPPPEGVSIDAEGRWVVKVVRGWASPDDTEAEAAGIALNRIGEAGGWRKDVLAEMLGNLSASSPEAGLVGVGYGPTDLADLLAGLAADRDPPPTLNDPDDVPGDPVVPVSKLGDLWVLGEHRLLCGDATVRADYDRLLDGGRLSGVLVTDPPYGVGIGAKNRALASIGHAGGVLTDLEGDEGLEEVEVLWRAAFPLMADVLAEGCPYYINGPQGGDLGLLLLLLLKEAGLMPRHILIWVKNRASFSIGRLDYDYQHEPIVYGWKPGGPHPWYAPDAQTSVFHVDRPNASPDHPTPKPVALLTQLIANSSRPDALVLDPFGGSGSTLIAAHQTGRRARLLELSPGYCDVICRRFQEHTGIKPVLESTGEPVDFGVEAAA